MNLDNDYDNEGNNIVPCPICLNVYCPSKQDGKCPEEDEYAASFNTMQETLQTRLQREAREKLSPNVTYIDPKFAEVASWAEELLNAFWVEQQKDLDQIISHTIAETIKAGVSVIEGDITEEPLYVGKTQYEFYKGDIRWVANQALQTAVTKLQELYKTNSL